MLWWKWYQSIYKNIYDHTIARQKFIISQGYNLITMWEHEWDNMDTDNKYYSDEEILDHYYICKLNIKLNDNNNSKELEDAYSYYTKWYREEYNGSIVSKRKFYNYYEFKNNF